MVGISDQPTVSCRVTTNPLLTSHQHDICCIFPYVANTADDTFALRHEPGNICTVLVYPIPVYLLRACSQARTNRQIERHANGQKGQTDKQSRRASHTTRVEEQTGQVVEGRYLPAMPTTILPSK